MEKKLFINTQNLLISIYHPIQNLQQSKKLAFYKSRIEVLNFPHNLTDLEAGLCSHMKYIIGLIVKSQNPQFYILNGIILLRKSSLDPGQYGTLELAYRFVRDANIHRFAKHIGHYVFEFCEYITEVEIPEDSKLLMIGRYAYYESSVSCAKIPPSQTMIDEYAFFYSCISKFEIPSNSYHQTKILNNISFKWI